MPVPPGGLWTGLLALTGAPSSGLNRIQSTWDLSEFVELAKHIPDLTGDEQRKKFP